MGVEGGGRRAPKIAVIADIARNRRDREDQNLTTDEHGMTLIRSRAIGLNPARIESTATAHLLDTMRRLLGNKCGLSTSANFKSYCTFLASTCL